MVKELLLHAFYLVAQEEHDVRSARPESGQRKAALGVFQCQNLVALSLQPMNFGQ